MYFICPAAPALDPDVALAAAAAPAPALATQDRGLAAAPTPGQDPALALTARALEAVPGPGQRVVTEQIATASHVPSPKIKVRLNFPAIIFHSLKRDRFQYFTIKHSWRKLKGDGCLCLNVPL